MVKQNLSAAFQGLVVVPIFAGYDNHAAQGRIFKYDVTGGRYEERQFYATGSGGKEARSTLRKQFRDGLSRTGGTALALEALVDAADIDVGTSGPDLARGIYRSSRSLPVPAPRMLPTTNWLPRAGSCSAP